jgi:WD40 repeat protein
MGEVLTVKSNVYGSVLVSGGADSNMFIWDLRSNKPLMHTLSHSKEVLSVDIYLDSSIIASSSREGYWY